MRVAVVGATGVVGQEMIKTLEQRNFPVTELIPLASAKSAGKEITFKGQRVAVQELTEASFKGIHIALFSAGGSISQKFAPIAVAAGAIVIDNSSYFRMHEDVPLVVPEVNADAIKSHKGIIANPNCSTAQLVMALQPIHQLSPIKRLVISTYQSVSGAGKAAIDELIEHTKAALDGKTGTPEVFSYPMGFNLIPQIDSFLDNGYTKEEMKLINETQKIMGAKIDITATAVRVPVVIGHSESVNIETESALSVDQVRQALSDFPNVEVLDDPANKVYPTPRPLAGRDETFVGRIRKDPSNPKVIDCFVVSDNLRKGAALNAVQIAEACLELNLVAA